MNKETLRRIKEKLENKEKIRQIEEKIISIIIKKD